MINYTLYGVKTNVITNFDLIDLLDWSWKIDNMFNGI